MPTGTVGIGGAQTGVYPLESPGGWNLIGRTTLSMFDATRSDASVLQTGDRVKFRPVEEAFVAPSPASDASGGIFAPPSALAPDGAVRVVKPGVLTTIQDLGRTGHRADGVPLSGAADAFALRLANLLVGNAENAAALEFALVGPELYFARDALVALTGGEFTGLPGWHPHRIAAGTTLSLGAATRGCRGYLAVGGGFAVEPVVPERPDYANDFHFRRCSGEPEPELLADGVFERWPVTACQSLGDHRHSLAVGPVAGVERASGFERNPHRIEVAGCGDREICARRFALGWLWPADNRDHVLDIDVRLDEGHRGHCARMLHRWQ